MPASVFDTNVLIIANRQHNEEMACVLRCVEELERAKAEKIVLDDAFRILNEYKRNVNQRGQPGVGDTFLLWLLQNMWVQVRCEQVHISEHPKRSFEGFPDSLELAGFDKDDRKFVAVALASVNDPEIVVAADYDDWQPYREALSRFAVRVYFPCLEDRP